MISFSRSYVILIQIFRQLILLKEPTNTILEKFFDTEVVVPLIIY